MADPSETTQIGSGPSAEDESAGESTEVLEAIRQLSGQVGSLQSEVRTLRAQTRALPAGATEVSGWDDARSADTLAWVRALDAPTSRAPVVPRMLLEIVFLVSVAVAAAIAELDVVAIVGVMAAAWLLVALAELAASRAARRRADAVYAPLPGPGSGLSDGSVLVRAARRAHRARRSPRSNRRRSGAPSASERRLTRSVDRLRFDKTRLSLPLPSRTCGLLPSSWH